MREAAAPSLARERVFSSFFQAGFECSTHRRADGNRLDLLQATGHAAHCLADYRQVKSLGMKTVRDGIRWHLIEPAGSNSRTWDSFLPMLRASRETGVEVVWDLMHYGWPDDVDIWKPDFVRRFAAFAAATARLVRSETDRVPFYCPINEISFFSWAGGDRAFMNPMAEGRSFELKVQLVRAALEATDAIRAVDPRARFLYCDPVVRIFPKPGHADDVQHAIGYENAQYQAWDMLSGALWPQLGGDPSILDIVGVNYYPNNQWYYEGEALHHDHPLRVPFSTILADVASRYGRPVVVSETGAEADQRAGWFKMIADEVERALLDGIDVQGICLYPIIDHVGWDDERACESGLLSIEMLDGARRTHAPLEQVLNAQRRQMPPW